MNIRRIIVCLCMIIAVSTPLTVKANNESNRLATLKESEIYRLDPEEAKRIHLKALQDQGINPLSDLSMSTMSVTGGDNVIYVTCYTGSRKIADRIGVRNFTFQAKSGFFWETKKVTSGYLENTDAYFDGFYMTNPKSGTQYRVSGTHYCIINGVETSGYNEADPYTYQ